MTWRWDATDIPARLRYALKFAPQDILTLFSMFVMRHCCSAIAMLVWPFELVLKGTVGFLLKGGCVFVWGMLILMVLDLVWMTTWLLLMLTSSAWIKMQWLRPILIIPGLILALVSYIFVSLAPDPQKNSEYHILIKSWPMSWRVWSPKEEYFKGAVEPEL